MKKMLFSCLSIVMLMSCVLGCSTWAIAENEDELARAVEYGFVSEEMAVSPDSAITWKQFCEMAGRMIETYDASALPAWQELTANAPDTPMKRDGGMMSMLFAAKTISLHTFNAGYPQDGMSDDLWAYATMDYPVFPFNNPIDLGEGVSCICHVGPAYDYCMRRVSLISGKGLLEPDASGSMRFADDFTVREAAQAVLRLYESDEAVVTEIKQAENLQQPGEFKAHAEADVDIEVETVDVGYYLDDSASVDEYNRALEYGFIPEHLLDTNPDAIIVTWKEYCTMIYNYLRLMDENAAQKWLSDAEMALSSDDYMVREQGCFALYRALEINDLAISPEDSAVVTNVEVLENIARQEDYRWDCNAYAGTGGEFREQFFEEHEVEGGTETYWQRAMKFCHNTISYVTGAPLYNTQVRINQPLTLRSAAISLVRSYESFHEHAIAVLKQTTENLFEEVRIYGEPAEVTEKREKILNTPTTIVKGDTYIPGKTYTGKAYYVSNNGNDANDGLSPETAWATLDRINNSVAYAEAIESGDAIFFERGGFWRGHLMIWWATDITVSAYGQGEKPIITSSPENGADEEKWELVHEGQNGEKIWKFHRDMTDTGMVVLNDETAGWRVAPRWTGSEWVNWDGTPFDVKTGLTKDLDYFVDIGGLMPGTTEFNDYQDSPYVSYGALHMRCDEGNPGAVFESIEFASMVALPSDSSRLSSPISLESGYTLDNICVKYYPMGASGNPNNGAVQNCEFAWGGGCVQFVRDGWIAGAMGDALFGAWQENCIIRNNYFHDLTSAGLTIEGSIEHGDGGPSHDITFADNLLVNSMGAGFFQERNGFRNLNITGNVFFNNENYWAASYIWNGGWAPTVYRKFINFQRGSDSLETYYENCSIKNNSFYYPLQFFLVCGIDQSVLPEFGNNTYYLAENSIGFASWIVNPNGGGFEPVFKDNAEAFLREYLKDETSVIVQPGETYVREAQENEEASENFFGYEEMTVGSKGDHVQVLQQLLINRGYLSDKADGIFGNKTAEAVKDAQADFGFEQNGVANEAFLRAFYGNQ